ncbi:hypothetical protein ACQ33O_00845 [Ferruginibacter sp. SUN002]
MEVIAGGSCSTSSMVAGGIFAFGMIFITGGAAACAAVGLYAAYMKDC